MRARRILAGLAAGLWAGGLFGVVAPASGLSAGPPLPLPVERIDLAAYPNVKAIITAPRRASVDTLTAGNFRIVEGNAVRPITVTRLATSELAVVLVMDTSQSMSGAAMGAAQQAAKAFVQTMPAGVPVAVVGFANAPTVQSPFTTDHAATVAALSTLRAKGNTTLYDAVLKAVALHAQRPSQPNARKVMVLLTDGGDTRSVASLSDVSAALGASGISLSAIALATRESDLASLSVLASSAGGKVVSASDPAALQGVFGAISDSVLNQYEVAWTAKSRGATRVSIDLAAKDATYRAIQTIGFPRLAPAPTPSNAPSPISPSLRVNAPPSVSTAGSDRLWLLLGVGAGFAALLTAAAVTLWPRAPRRRLAAEYGRAAAPELSSFTKRMVRLTDRFLQRGGRQLSLQRLLERAGLKTEPATALVFAGAVGFCALALGLMFGNFLLALLFAVAAVGLLYLIVLQKAERRSDLFQEQFETTLQIMSNSLKAGYGISQAIDTVARESDAPTNEEFRRVVRETRLGMDQIVALENCAHRVKCDDLLWLTDAISVNRDVGGNLTELFAGVAVTLRARSRLARQVMALSAEGRLSAKIMIALPFLVIAWTSIVNRRYLEELFRGVGPYLLLAAIGLMTTGYLWTRRIVRVDY